MSDATAMRAALLPAPGTPLRVVELELAPPGPGEVLVGLRASGVCQDDLNVLDGTVENFNVDCHGRSPSDARGERAAICLSRAMRAASRRPYAGLIIRP